MDLFLKHLESLDINSEEAAIYLNAIESKASTILEFAQNTAIPRTTVYLLVDSLINKGLLKEEVQGKRKQYVPVSPNELVQLAKQKEQLYKETALLLQKDISQLNSIYNRERQKPLLYVKEGLSNIREIFIEASNASEVYVVVTSSKGQQVLSDQLEMFNEYSMKNMITTKIILANIQQNHRLKENISTERNKIGLLEEKYNLNVDYLIYSDNVVIITYQDVNPHCVIIKDQDLAYSERIKFNLLFEKTT